MVKIDITATDRMGQVLETRTVIGDTYSLTFKERGEVYADLKARYRDFDGSGPFIFTKSSSVS